MGEASGFSQIFFAHGAPTLYNSHVSAYLDSAIEAAQAAGGFLRAHFGRPLNVDANEAHDIKLELFENDGEVGCKLSWEAPTMAKEFLTDTVLSHKKDKDLDK